MTEIVKSLRAALYERATSPLLGSFVIFWIYFNWKALSIIVLGEGDILFRISHIESDYPYSYRNILCPALYAAAYSVLYPYLSLFFYTVARYAHVWKISIRNKIEKINTISFEKYNQLKSEILENEKKLSDLLEEKTNYEKQLEENISYLEKEMLEEKKKNIGGIFSNITNEKREELVKKFNEVLNLIGNQANDNVEEGLAYLSKQDAVKNRKMACNRQWYGCVTEWVNSIRDRIGTGDLNKVDQEFSRIIGELLHSAEDVRREIKNMKEGDEYTNEKERRNLEYLLEEWEVVRNRINEIVDYWKRIIQQDFKPLGIDAAGYYKLLRPIERL